MPIKRSHSVKTEKPVQRRLIRAYICLLLALLILAGVFVWRYAATHVYFILPSSVSYIEVQSVTSYAKLEEREEIEAAVRLINRFAYSSREELPPLGGEGVRVTVHYYGERLAFKGVRFSLGTDPDTGQDYLRKHNEDGSITEYFGPPGYFQPLHDLLKDGGA